MGTPGVLLDIPKEVLVCALKKNKGVLSRVGVSLDICRDSVRKLVVKHDLQELLDTLRCNYKNTLLDDAEDNLSFAMQQRDKDLNNALKASFFVLNNMGRERGYTPPTARVNPDGSTPDCYRDFVAAHTEPPRETPNS